MRPPPQGLAHAAIVGWFTARPRRPLQNATCWRVGTPMQNRLDFPPGPVHRHYRIEAIPRDRRGATPSSQGVGPMKSPKKTSKKAPKKTPKKNPPKTVKKTKLKALIRKKSSISKKASSSNPAIDDIFKDWNKNDSTGMAVAVRQYGQVVFRHGLGLADS